MLIIRGDVHDVEPIIHISRLRGDADGSCCSICISGDSAAEIRTVFEIECVEGKSHAGYIVELSFKEEIMRGTKLAKFKPIVRAKQK